MRRIFRCGLACAAIFYSWHSLSAISVIHRPVNLGVTGLQSNIEGSLDDPEKFLWARLYVRRSNEGAFFPISMTGSGRYFNARIPGMYAVEQGTDYYIEITLQDKSKVFYPSGAPSSYQTIRNQPANLKISVTILSPDPGSKINERLPKFSASVRGLDFLGHKEKVTAYLDDRPVQARIEYGFVTYQSTSALAPGQHTFKVTVRDEKDTIISSAESRFEMLPQLTPEEQIRLFEEDKRKGKKQIELDEWKSTGSLGTTYQYSETTGSNAQIPYPQGYYTVQGQFQATKDDMTFFLGPFSITSQKVEAGQRIHQLSAGVKKGPFETKWGTVSSQLTELSASGAGYLGGEFSWDNLKDEKKAGYRFKTFAGQTRIPIEQNADPNRLGVFSQRVYGGQVAWAPVDSIGFMSLQAADVKDDRESIITSGLIPSTRNQAGSVYGKVFLPAFTTIKYVEGEYGINKNEIESVFFTDLGDKTTSKVKTIGQGFSVKGSGELTKISTNYNIRFKRMDPRFLTALGASQADTFSYGGDLAHSLLGGKITLGEGVDLSNDNLENQKPTTTSTRSGNANVGLNFAPWPSFNVTNSIQQQENDDKNSPLQQLNNALSASTNYTLKIRAVTLSLGFSYSQINIWDLSATRNSDDQLNRTYSPTLSFSPFGWLSLSGGYSLGKNQNLTKGGVNTTETKNGSANLNFLGGALSFPLTFSHTQNYDDKTPRQNDTESFNYGFGVQAAFGGSHRLSLQGSLNQNRDKINSLSNYDQVAITLSYNATLQ